MKLDIRHAFMWENNENKVNANKEDLCLSRVI